MREEQKIEYSADEGLKGVFLDVSNTTIFNTIKYCNIDLHKFRFEYNNICVEVKK
jgi:hypothetical protein